VGGYQKQPTAVEHQPGLSGFDVCKLLRARQAPAFILMLTAKGQELDKVIGLDLGADDYVTKPFGVRELLARINALLRRAHAPATAEDTAEDFRIGEAHIDAKKYEVSRPGAKEPLSAKELKLLQLFHTRRREVLSRDTLLNQVWGYHYYGATRTLDQVIVQLRRKLGDNAAAPRHLITVHRVL
jgi:DNA-binding response OmpR family regulator